MLSSPKDSASSAGGFLINDVAVLQVFSRFYAGRTMQDYVEDVLAGLRMLEVSTRVKRDAIGIYGISLGGFQAVHGAARAPLSVTPVRGAAWAPPLDPLAFARYIQDSLPAQFDDPMDPKLAEYQEFFDPFVRRILPATGLQTTNTLAANLDTNFLLFACPQRSPLNQTLAGPVR